MEFRLIRMHYLHLKQYEIQYDQWIGYRYMDIVAILAATAGCADSAKFKEHTNETAKGLRRIVDLLDPFVAFREKLTAEEAARANMTEAQRDTAKERYLDVLTRNGGFDSVDQIREAVSGLNNVIKDFNADVHPAATAVSDKQ